MDTADSWPSTAIDALQRTVAEFGDDRGIQYYFSPEKSEYRSFAELDARARAIADGLARAGFGPDQSAVIALSPGLSWADAAYGVMYAGMAIVPAPTAGFDSAARGERIAGLARAAAASVLITETVILDTLGDALTALDVTVVTLDELLSDGDAHHWVDPGVDAETTAILLFTSGSTGEPKGAITTHRNIMTAADSARELTGAGPDSVTVGWLPLHHTLGLMVQVIVPATTGGASVITPTEQFQRRPLVWLQLISKHRATISVAGNFAFALVTQLATDEQIAELDLSSLRTLISGSEPVRAETVHAFLERFASTGITEAAITPAMGMTEAQMLTAKQHGDELVIGRFDGLKLEFGMLEPADDEDFVEMVSCGRPPRNTTLVIVDPETLTPVPDGRIGELWVSSPSVAAGYFRNPDATAEMFGHRLPDDERSWLRSGDLAAIIDSQLFVTGRLKELIIIRGRNIYPQDIEAAARQVSPALGLGAAFELDGPRLGVGIVVEASHDALGEDETLETLAARVLDVIPKRFSLPFLAVAFVPDGTLPRTATGKVRRKPTRAQIERGDLPTLYSTGFPRELAATRS